MKEETEICQTSSLVYNREKLVDRKGAQSGGRENGTE